MNLKDNVDLLQDALNLYQYIIYKWNIHFDGLRLFGSQSGRTPQEYSFEHIYLSYRHPIVRGNSTKAHNLIGPTLTPPSSPNGPLFVLSTISGSK